MRMIAAIVFALIALAAGGLWLLGAAAPRLGAPEATHETASVAPAPAPESAGPAAPAAAPSPTPAEPDATHDNELESRPFDPRATLNDIDLPTRRARNAPASSELAAAEPAAPEAAKPDTQLQASLADQFKSRKVAYNRPPSPMALGKPLEVSLVINATNDADAADKALDGFSGEIVGRDVDLTDTVSAQLTSVGGGFEIVSETVERQRLSGRVVNRWQWRVTPTEAGKRTLLLEIFGYRSGSADAEPLDAYRDEINVEVKQFDRVIGLARDAQPVFAIIAGVAGAISALIALLKFTTGRKSA